MSRRTHALDALWPDIHLCERACSTQCLRILLICVWNEVTVVQPNRLRAQAFLRWMNGGHRGHVYGRRCVCAIVQCPIGAHSSHHLRLYYAFEMRVHVYVHFAFCALCLSDFLSVLWSQKVLPRHWHITLCLQFIRFPRNIYNSYSYKTDWWIRRN